MKRTSILLSILLASIWTNAVSVADFTDLPLPAEVFEVDGKQAFVMKPKKALAGNPWVWYAPTLTNLPNGMLKFYSEQWLEQGIAVAGNDLGEVRGAPKSSQQFSRFYDAMVEKGYSTKPVLLGQSRGGLMMLSWAFRNPDKVQAFAGIYPVCNLADWPLRAMKQATLVDYGLSEEALLKQMVTFNPPNNLAQLVKNRVPLFILHGDSDNVVPYNQNSRLIKEAYEKAGGDIEVIVIPGQGHNGSPEFFKNQDLLGFIAKQCSSLSQQSVQAQTQALFNGKDLTGWRGEPALWSVVDGAIMGQTTSAGQIKSNTFLIYDKPFANFELNLKYKILSGNSGVQYRAKLQDEQLFRVTGYQADIDSGATYSGILYEEGGRGIVAQRGQQVTLAVDGKRTTNQVADASELQSEIKQADWNDYRIVANGQRLQHFINGNLTADVTDQEPNKRAASGVLALQLHAGPAMQVFFKDITIKTLPSTLVKSKLDAAPKAIYKSTVPTWIWHRDAQSVEAAVFRKTFSAKVGQKAIVRGSCDNNMTVMLNGKQVVSSSQWEKPAIVDVSASLVAGKNELRVIAKDNGGIAALALSITVDDVACMTDETWQSATPDEAQANQWSEPIKIGMVGDPALPWSSIVTPQSFELEVPVVGQTGPEQTALAVDLHVPEGFQAELVYTVPKSTQGSWVGLTTDGKGRLYTSDQANKGMYRITPAIIGDPKSLTKVEKINVDVSAAQGMCWAFDSLYVNCYGTGVWRIQDTDGDDNLDKAENIISIANGGEHGMHAVIESPDGTGIYFLAGNHSPPPKFETSRSPTNWDEDLLLPRNWDPRGHAKGKLAPGGWIARSNPDGSNIEIVSTGYRNQYDIAFGRNGEMFTYDADMEWDTGTPWYRPTRVCHATSGSEFGWRSGSGKWPAYFEDSVPPAVDIGPGSPTGVVFGTGAKFPERYQNALFILDWTFGTIYAIHLEPKGATYTATKEHFAWSKPLPVTDTIVGKDGALYFTVGGRGTDSALYRITYAGSESTELVSGPIEDDGTPARELRHQLEGFHKTEAPNALAIAWPHLGSDDRAIRFAARIAIENQPVDAWREQALNETNAQASIVAMIALARQGAAADLPRVVSALARLELSALSTPQQLAALRAYSLAFTRLGEPSEAMRQSVISKLDPLFPGLDEEVNTELARVLIYLESPTVVEKVIGLIENPKPTKLPDWAELAKRNDSYGRSISKMLADMPPLQSIQYAFMLRNATQGWTPKSRAAYFDFFVDVSKKPGGPSYAGYLTTARKDAMANLTVAEKHRLAGVLGRPLVAPAVKSTPPQGPGREWTTAQAVSTIGNKLENRDFAKGQNLFHALQCSSCHYFAGSGGSIGPDLTTVANKFSTRDLLEAIVEPSKIISDQYGSKTILDLDGRVATGLAVDEGSTISVYANDPSTPPTVFQKADIDEIKESKTSQMAQGLINTVNPEELKDFIAYLKSGGDRKSKMFKQK
ncbi:MAG: putative heme-binding domain-containing protein [Mariniblastus sp.]|jgi:putative heme-binding domain-containing protein